MQKRKALRRMALSATPPTGLLAASKGAGNAALHAPDMGTLASRRNRNSRQRGNSQKSRPPTYRVEALPRAAGHILLMLTRTPLQ